MKELLTYIVQNLVDHPDEVSVTERKSTYSGETIYEVRVADGDMGKVKLSFPFDYITKENPNSTGQIKSCDVPDVSETFLVF